MDDLAGAIRDLEELLRRLSHQVNIHTRTYLAAKGLTMARFWVLCCFTENKPMTMGELQRVLQLVPGTLTGLVNGLVEENLVRRWREGVNDRRLVYLALTPEGQELLAGIIRHRASFLEEALKEAAGVDLQHLNGHLSLLLERILAQAVTQGE